MSWEFGQPERSLGQPMMLRSLGPVGSQPLQKGGSGGLAGPARSPNQPHNPGSENRHTHEASLCSEGEREGPNLWKIKSERKWNKKDLMQACLASVCLLKGPGSAWGPARCSSIPAPILSLVSPLNPLLPHLLVSALLSDKEQPRWVS